MAIKTNREILDEGFPPVPGEGDSLDPSIAYGNGLTVSTWGKSTSPTKWGEYVTRVASTVEEVAVATDTATAAKPGPILHVEITAGGITGPVAVTVVAAPAAGQVKITTGEDGLDVLTFFAGDSVTECAYRQLSMPTEILTKLDEDTAPPITA